MYTVNGTWISKKKKDWRVEFYMYTYTYSIYYQLYTSWQSSFLHMQVVVTADKDSEASYKLKQLIRSVGTGLIQEKLGQYIKELRQGSCFLHIM